jgi:predicted patatin/cPLA2 family phospholipase
MDVCGQAAEKFMTHAIQTLQSLHWSTIQTLVFAGGGNRCWWQGGLMETLIQQGYELPKTLVGTSAGAGVAASLITATPSVALAGCEKLYAKENSIFNRKTCTFAHDYIYPAWLESFLDERHVAHIKQSTTRLQVAVTQPARWLGLHGTVLAGTLAYMVDKHISHSIHPRLPRRLGLRQAFEWLDVPATAQGMRQLLSAAGAAPPFMPPVRLSSDWAIDGGFTDNAPIPAQTPLEASQTLVLLTRFYDKLPTLFTWQGRSYLQASRAIPVSTFDCTHKATVRDAFGLGIDDANTLISQKIFKQ